MSEWTLSEQIISEFEVIGIDDVKEFVQRIKKEIELQSAKEGELNYFVVYKAIDKLAGEELA